MVSNLQRRITKSQPIIPLSNEPFRYLMFKKELRYAKALLTLATNVDQIDGFFFHSNAGKRLNLATEMYSILSSPCKN